MDFTEHRADIIYNSDQGNFNMSPDSLKNIVTYEDKLNGYRGKVKVELNHYTELNISSSSKEAVEDYIERLKRELRNSEYFSWVEYDTTFYKFKRSSNATDNIQLNYELQLTFD